MRMTSRSVLPAVVLAALLAGQPAAHAHIALTFPTPRTADQKTGPCGAAGSTRGTKVSTFRPGETLTIEWDETVDHPGHYRIAFDGDGNDSFQNPVNTNDNFAGTLADQIADRSGGHYTQQITLPSTPCSNCTLQLMQIMTTVVPYNSFYYQCADIVLSETGDPTEPPGDGGCAAGGAPAGGAPAAGLLALVALGLGRRLRRRA